MVDVVSAYYRKVRIICIHRIVTQIPHTTLITTNTSLRLVRHEHVRKINQLLVRIDVTMTVYILE